MSTAADTDNVPFLTRDEIENRARDVLRQHGLQSIPVNLIELFKRLGISALNAKFADPKIVGAIAREGGETTVLVNQADPPARKLFTLAHELGHYCLHLQKDGEHLVDGEANLYRLPKNDQDKPGPDRRREIQANLFAAALLMPEEDVRREWPRLRSVEAMARLFNVSEAAMGIRIDQLGLE